MNGIAVDASAPRRGYMQCGKEPVGLGIFYRVVISTSSGAVPISRPDRGLTAGHFHVGAISDSMNWDAPAGQSYKHRERVTDIKATDRKRPIRQTPPDTSSGCRPVPRRGPATNYLGRRSFHPSTDSYCENSRLCKMENNDREHASTANCPVMAAMHRPAISGSSSKSCNHSESNRVPRPCEGRVITEYTMVADGRCRLAYI